MERRHLLLRHRRRTGGRHGDDELHVPAAILDRATDEDPPRPYKYSAEASLAPVLRFPLISQTLAHRPISLAAVRSHPKHRREAPELRLVFSFPLANVRLLGSFVPDESSPHFTAGHQQSSTFAVDVGHHRPRRHARRTRGELLYRMACSPCFLDHRSIAAP
jgi:hypothetical protein